MFWIGLTVGLFVGANIGAVAMGWFAAGKIADLKRKYGLH
jgi:hypothetical protein